MVAAAIALSLAAMSFTFATGGMRVEESNSFIFSKACGSFLNPTSFLECIFINGDPVLDVWKLFCKGGEGAISFMTWFTTTGATLTFESSDLKSFRTANAASTGGVQKQKEGDNASIPVTTVVGRMPEVGILEPIRIVLILLILANALSDGGKADPLPKETSEVNIMFNATKSGFAGALRHAASFVVQVDGGKVAWNSLFRASQSQEIPLRNNTFTSKKIQAVAHSNGHSLPTLFRWYGYGKALFKVCNDLIEQDFCPGLMV